MAVIATPGIAHVALINPKNLFHEIGEDKELLRALIATAQRDLPEALIRMELAAKELDYPQVRQQAHTMKTTLAHWEAVDSLELAQKVELLCRQERSEEAVVLIPALKKAVEKVLLALEKVEELV